MKTLTFGLFTTILCLGLIETNAQLPNCTDSFDGTNLVAGGSFEDITALSIGDGPTEEPDCWIRLNTPILGQSNNYNALNNKYISNIAGYLVYPVTEGYYGNLHHSVTSGQEYLVTFMYKTGNEWALTNQDMWGFNIHLDDENLANTPLPFPDITPLPDNGLVFNISNNSQDVGPFLFPTQQSIATPPLRQVIVNSEWAEANILFTADNSYSNLLLFATTGIEMDGSFAFPNVDDIRLVPTSSDPISMYIIDENQNAEYNFETDISCGEELTVTYHVNTSTAIVNSNDITLSLNLPQGLSIIGGDGVTSFDNNGELVIPTGGLDQTGFDITAVFTPLSTFQPETTEIVSIDISNSSAAGYLSHISTASITMNPFCLHDGNGDGQITASDLTHFLSFWQQQPDACGHHDSNFNNVIGSDDFSSFLGVFGQDCD